ALQATVGSDLPRRVAKHHEETSPAKRPHPPRTAHYRRLKRARKYRCGPSDSAAGRANRHAGTALASFSIRIAVALNSAVPDLGSVASIVRMLVATPSWTVRVMNGSPGRRDGWKRTGTSHA